ncbi:hypothetical protein BG006_006683 [Podila minutissima]|uniref:YhhN-like protein n=1 Tax=Podila minutissima TaxID=64525 RepID=A0A9P5SM94_9FUNG|nr:hypothetical protein BG006_006683 [Podila minutissima]
MDAAISVAKPLVDFLQPLSLSPINVGVQITAVALPCLLLSETAKSALGRWIFKPIASFGFLVAALSYIPTPSAGIVASSTTAATTFNGLAGLPTTVAEIVSLASAYASEIQHVCTHIAPSFTSAMPAVAQTTYTKAMMGAFILGWIGDVLLIPARGFLPGLVSFLTGHAAFMIAFTLHGQDNLARQKGAGFIVAMAAIVGPWLIPKIKNKIMRGAVIAYMLVISAMVITAVGSVNCDHEFLPERIVGAIMFFLSDLFVARQHFVHKSVLNKWIGLPLYYGGQILLASTLRGEQMLVQ